MHLSCFAKKKVDVHGHIYSKVRSKLAPETTEKLVYVYANRRLVSKICESDALKMCLGPIE